MKRPKAPKKLLSVSEFWYLNSVANPSHNKNINKLHSPRSKDGNSLKRLYFQFSSVALSCPPQNKLEFCAGPAARKGEYFSEQTYDCLFYHSVSSFRTYCDFSFSFNCPPASRRRFFVELAVAAFRCCWWSERAAAWAGSPAPPESWAWPPCGTPVRRWDRLANSIPTAGGQKSQPWKELVQYCGCYSCWRMFFVYLRINFLYITPFQVGAAHCYQLKYFYVLSFIDYTTY